MIINHNMSAQFADRLLKKQMFGFSKSMQKIASGERINSAGDDASGLAVSEQLRSQIRGLMQAGKNAQSGISFIQVAEGSLQEVHSILHRVRELSIQGANGIYSNSDRNLMQVEVSQLISEIDRVATATEFNRFKILDGSLQSLRLHVGANADQSISVFINTMTSRALGVDSVSVSTADKANEAIGRIDNAVNIISKQRASFGAVESRLNHTVSSIGRIAESSQYAESLIRDTDMSSEVVDFTKYQILAQTATAVEVQANLMPNLVMQLLN